MILSVSPLLSSASHSKSYALCSHCANGAPPCQSHRLLNIEISLKDLLVKLSQTPSIPQLSGCDQPKARGFSVVICAKPVCNYFKISLLSQIIFSKDTDFVFFTVIEPGANREHMSQEQRSINAE